MSQRALIIDDNPNNGNILAEMLQMEGIEPTIAQDPTKVESLIAKQPDLDVIFLDLEMPKLNGFEVFDKISVDPRLKDVPIVAYTVHVSEINVVRQHGFHSFLGKPLDADQFSAHLARILRGESVWVLP